MCLDQEQETWGCKYSNMTPNLMTTSLDLFEKSLYTVRSNQVKITRNSRKCQHKAGLTSSPVRGTSISIKPIFASWSLKNTNSHMLFKNKYS